MKTQRRIQLTTLTAALVMAFGLCTGLGRNVLEVESRYRGDGWFDYHLRTLEDPFFTSITFGLLAPGNEPGYPFTNHVENTLPLGWTNYFQEGVWSGIMCDGSVPQPRINEISFSVRSSFTHFKQSRSGFLTVLFLQFTDRYIFSGGLGGYACLGALVPCAPEEADGSPSELISRLELVRDIKIDGLVLTNGQVHGLTFSWSSPSTVELQGSHDMVAWTTVARFFGDPPQTTWTTNTPLNSFGTFFRLSLVANYHMTNALAPMTFAGESQQSPEIPIRVKEFVGNQIKLGFASTPQAVYEVEHRTLGGVMVGRKQVEATTEFTTVCFDVSEGGTGGFFKARRLAK